MPIIPRHPFWDLERFFESSEFPSMKTPKVDVYDTEKEVTTEVELPGIDPEDIEVEVEKDRVKIKAEKEEKEEEKKKGYYRKEISRGYYQRVVPLPVQVKEDQAQAVYEDGILKVTAPKAEPEQEEKEGKKVKVETV